MSKTARVESSKTTTSQSYPSPRSSPDMSRGGSAQSGSGPASAEWDGIPRSASSRSNPRSSARAPNHSATDSHDDYSASVPRNRVPLSPPLDPEQFETDEEWRTYHDQQEKVGPWHHLPLVLVALPPVGAIIHGRAENWTDGMILLLVCFYLYHLVRVPWDLYYASRTRRILSAATIDGDEDSEPASFAHERQKAVHKLQKSELISLGMTIFAPGCGAYLLFLARGMLSDPDRYINRFTISLFALATAVKPLLHLAELFRRRALFYQEVVHYPSTQVHFLRRKVESLESELRRLNHNFATKADIKMLRSETDVPMTALAKRVRLSARQEEYTRLSTEERFALLDAKLEEATREVYLNAQLVEKLKQEYDSASHPITTILRVLNHMMGPRFRGQQNGKHQSRLRWWNTGPMFYILLPLNLPTMAVEWAATKAIKATETAR